MFVYPWRRLLAQSVKTRLSNQALTGDPSLSGGIQATRTDGGGLWLSDHSKIIAWDPDTIRCLRAWSAYLDGGATQFILPCFDLGQAPRPLSGGAPALPGAPTPSSDYFNEDPGFGAPLISAHLTAGAALRATNIGLQVDVGTPVVGGEHFSLNHPTVGWRMHRIVRVTSVDGPYQAVDIKPPLREAIAVNSAIEFDVPRFQAQLVPSKADEFEPDLSLGRFASVNAYFMEAF